MSDQVPPSEIESREILKQARARALDGAPEVLASDVAPSLVVDLGAPVRVAFADPHLADVFGPSIDHLAYSSPPEPVFSILITDSRHFGEVPGSRAELAGLIRTEAFELDDAGGVAMEPGSMVSAVDWAESIGVWWLDEHEGTTNWQVSAPMRQILAWWSLRQGGVLAHAAVVGHEGRGVMITAPSGCGKSTTAMRAGIDGLSILSDDYCLVELGDAPVARATTRAVKVSDESLALLGGHVGTLDNRHRGGPDQKNLVYLPASGPGAFVPELDLVGVVVPEITGRERAEIGPVSGAAALSALAMTSIFQFNTPRAEVLARCGSLIATLPTYGLALGSDLGSATDALRDVISGQSKS